MDLVWICHLGSMHALGVPGFAACACAIGPRVRARLMCRTTAGCDILRCSVGRVVVKKTALADVQRVLVVEKELIQLDQHAVERAKEQDEESEKGVADGVACALVEDANGVEKIQLTSCQNKRESTKKVRMVHGTRSARAVSVQIWCAAVLRARVPGRRHPHERSSMEDTCGTSGSKPTVRGARAQCTPQRRSAE